MRLAGNRERAAAARAANATSADATAANAAAPNEVTVAVTAATVKDPTAAADPDGSVTEFIAAASFAVPKEGYAFKQGAKGLGYYLLTVASDAAQKRAGYSASTTATAAQQYNLVGYLAEIDRCSPQAMMLTAPKGEALLANLSGTVLRAEVTIKATRDESSYSSLTRRVLHHPHDDDLALDVFHLQAGDRYGVTGGGFWFTVLAKDKVPEDLGIDGEAAFERARGP